jgi:hypothetical protein
LGREFSFAAGEEDLFEGLAWEVGGEIRGADGVPVSEWAQGFYW